MVKLNNFSITSSVYLDRIMTENSFTSKTVLEQIDYLNRLRFRNSGRRYSYGVMVDQYISDQSNMSLEFNNLIFLGQKVNSPIDIWYDVNKNLHFIRYPASTKKDSNSVFGFDPNGKLCIECNIKDFLRYDCKNTWMVNELHKKLLMLLRGLYENAWLKLKREKVRELKSKLDSSSVEEFLAAKRVAKTQAIMNIAMAIGALTGKLETYQKNISSVDSPVKAYRMFSEVESAWREFSMTQDANQKRLNSDPKIPGGKAVKKLVTTGG